METNIFSELFFVLCNSSLQIQITQLRLLKSWSL